MRISYSFGNSHESDLSIRATPNTKTPINAVMSPFYVSCPFELSVIYNLAKSPFLTLGAPLQKYSKTVHKMGNIKNTKTYKII
jgi:hypothetical protein